eukprot:m.38255 g.38255  ORF g.38255 m.38255 type:complete len:109 (-) comp5492_c0_seq2:164-490(-)
MALISSLDCLRATPRPGSPPSRCTIVQSSWALLPVFSPDPSILGPIGWMDGNTDCQALQHEYFSNAPGPTPPAALVTAGFLQAAIERERPNKRKSIDEDFAPPKRLEF